MFNIVTEACHSISEDENDIWYYYSSITAKIIFPIFYKNVFQFRINSQMNF